MIQCIQYRKSNFLGSPEWLTLPWGERGKDIYQQLYDKGFALAAVLERIDNAQLTKDDMSILQLSEILDRLTGLHEELNLWYHKISKEFSSPLYWQTQSTAHSWHLKENNQPCTLPPFKFHNLLVANTLVTYWGLQLFLSGTIAITCGRVLSMNTELPAQSSFPMSSQEGLDLRLRSLSLLAKNTGSQCVELATNIVRSMPYCLDDHMGLMGAQKSLFGMRVALFVLQRHPGEELQWCQAIYQEFERKKGLRYAREIAKLAGVQSTTGNERMIRP